jgi:hypothetical protein
LAYVVAIGSAAENRRQRNSHLVLDRVTRERASLTNPDEILVNLAHVGKGLTDCHIARVRVSGWLPSRLDVRWPLPEGVVALV